MTLFNSACHPVYAQVVVPASAAEDRLEPVQSAGLASAVECSPKHLGCTTSAGPAGSEQSQANAQETEAPNIACASSRCTVLVSRVREKSAFEISNMQVKTHLQAPLIQLDTIHVF